MPILPIDYSLFSPNSLLNSNQGKLYGVDKDWVSMAFANEASARSELLCQELIRFMIDDRGPISILAKTRREGLFFILKEQRTSKVNSAQAVEEAFVRAMFKVLFFSSDSLKRSTMSSIVASVLSTYYRSISKHPEMTERLRTLVLRVMLLSSSDFLSIFVNACIEDEKKAATLTQLVDFQQKIMSYFMKLPCFKTFLSSNLARQESLRFLEDMKRFQPHGDGSFMEHVDPDFIQAVYAGQWCQIQFAIHGMLDAMDQEEILDERSVVCESMDIVSQTPRLRAPLPMPNNPLDINNRPTQEIQPETNRGRFTPLTCCSFFSRPLSFMATTRGASMGVVPIAFDHV